ncbi:MAG: hypothetical protein MMC23_007139 [Stictis urceolatum]|nr:hypothetical protein [Stictis urceolata]
MEHESVDISQLKDLALWGSAFERASKHVDVASPSAPNRARFAVPENTARHDSTVPVLSQRSQSRGPERQKTPKIVAAMSIPEASNSASGSAKTRMSDGTQKSGCTEPLSQWAYEPSARTVSEAYQDHGSTNPQTYKPGEAGYVGFDRLSGLFEDKGRDLEEIQVQGDAGDADDDDDLGKSSPLDLPAAKFAESHSFAPPETPVTNGEKRDYNGNILENAFTTPRLPPANPFGQNGGFNGGGISISQAFKLTQAPSSPFANALPSDATSNKPTPGMQYGDRPSTAGPSSSPAKLERTSMKRSNTEPHTRWHDTQGSDKMNTMSSPTAFKLRSSPLAEYDLFDDEFDDTQVRLFKQRRRDQNARRQLSNISTQGKALLNRTNGIRKSPRNALLGPSPLSQRFTREPVIISDGSLSSTSDEETEHEEISNTFNGDEPDELAEDNKENFEYRHVQVPRTTGRIPTTVRKVRQHPQSSPISRRISGRLEDDSSSDELADVSSSQHVPGSSKKSRPRSVVAQPVAVADSQGSPTRSKRMEQVSNQNVENLPLPGSSSDSRRIIRESQTFKAPNTSQLDSSAAKRMVTQPSSQLSSSPTRQVLALPSSGTPKRKALHGAANAFYTAVEKECLPSSSPPGVAKSGRVPSNTNTGSEFDNMEDEDILPAHLRRSHSKRLVRDQLDSDTHGFNAGSSTNHEDTPSARGAALASTIPETGSVQRSYLRGETSPRALKAGNASSPLRSNEFPREKESRSTNSSRYETAKSRLTASPRKSQAQSLPPKVLRSSPKIAVKANPRSMKEIAAITASQEDLDELSLSIDLLTKEDKEFGAQMEQLSSPIPPGRKKLRGRSARTKTELVGKTTTSDSPTLSALSSQERNQRSRVEMAGVSEEQRDQGEGPSDEKENDISPRMAIPDQQQKQIQKDEIDEPAGEWNGAIIASAIPIHSPQGKRQPSREISQERIPGHGVLSQQPDPPPAPEIEREDSLDSAHKDPKAGSELPTTFAKSQTIRFPMRVFAFLRYKWMAYYPGTCTSIDPVKETYTISFIDGSESAVPAAQVKRLELREGDKIKIDLDGSRNHYFIVQRLQGGIDSNSEESKVTDIYGHTDVVVTAKLGSGRNEPEEQTFPVGAVYFPSTLKKQFTDRSPIYENDDLAIADGTPDNTPVEGHSPPITPLSRQRSAKIASKTSSALRNSLMLTANGGLFDKFIFAITSIEDRAMREETENSIKTNGGRVLATGFEELFSFAPTMSSRATTPSTRSSRTSTPSSSRQTETSHQTNDEPLSFRFHTDAKSPTLLLADHSSRINKYLQALALGVPCLHPRYVRDCLAQQKLLDWRCYLLPSGESEFFHKNKDKKVTISRWLPHITEPSDPDQWTLQKITNNRNKWLDGKHVLIVGAGSDKMEAYAFIALAMGAEEVSVAKGKQEARRILHKADDEDDMDTDGANQCHWDWVCVEKEDDGKPPTKKRKSSSSSSGSKLDRGFMTDAEMIEGLEGVKVVGTECVVQSLILGRLLDPSEL